MNRPPLHSMSFKDAVLRELSLERDREETKDTSVHVSRWMQISVEILYYDAKMSETKLSKAKLYTGLMNHGTAIIQHRFDDEISAHQLMRSKLLRSDDDFAKEFLYEFKPFGDLTLNKTKKQTIKAPEWATSYLGIVGSVFPIRYSAAIRLAMCYSLDKWMTPDDVGHKNCKTEIVGFEKSLNKYIDFCNDML